MTFAQRWVDTWIQDVISNRIMPPTDDEEWHHWCYFVQSKYKQDYFDFGKQLNWGKEWEQYFALYCMCTYPSLYKSFTDAYNNRQTPVVKSILKSFLGF